MNLFRFLGSAFTLAMMMACQSNIQVEQQLDQEVSIFPDYKEVTVPSNIAPLNFEVLDSLASPLQLIVAGGDQSFQVTGKDGVFDIPEDEWHDLLAQRKGQSVTMTVCTLQQNKWSAFRSFQVHIAPDEMDPYIVYRLIAPGYSPWDKMGIYQRAISTFEEKPIYENQNGDMNCANCHSFQLQNPQKMTMHVRAQYGGTVFLNNGQVEKVNSKAPGAIGSLAYSGWHPTEDVVAFSNNLINQVFFMSHTNRLEGFDLGSDVLVYNMNTHQVVGSPLTMADDVFETYPTFSPDGKYLYFCSARQIEPLPERYKEVHYNICRIGFDAKTMTFSQQVDTVYQAERDSMSCAFPRISPDGKKLVFVRTRYGQWTVWHKDADLCMIDLETGRLDTMDEANSPDTESYHTWSHNSRWMIFSSRRDDGLYTKPYFTYIDESGHAHKSFLLPQKNPRKFYEDRMRAFNIPEFITGPLDIDQRSFIDRIIAADRGVPIQFMEGSYKPAEQKPASENVTR